ATGTRPFVGDTSIAAINAILHHVPTSAAKLNPLIPAGLEQIIAKALEKDRDTRYHNAFDILADIKRIPHDMQLATSRTEPSAVRRRLAALAILVALVVFAALVVVP